MSSARVAAGALVITALSLALIAALTPALTFNDGLGNDGRVYAQMATALRHRGPDDEGYVIQDVDGAFQAFRGSDTVPELGDLPDWRSSGQRRYPVGLCSRRLSILDLSSAGHQPMASADGRFVIAYNGEIYNARDVAADLPGRNWRGHSDTEVLIEACAAWGVEKATQRFIGMFAFALWDKADHKLYLVRDRLGIKPLYYGRQDNVFLFTSELKALRAHPAFKAQVSPEAIAAYLRLGYVPSPLSVFEGILSLAKSYGVTRGLGWPATISRTRMWLCT